VRCFSLIMLVAWSGAAFAHGGGLDASGCHMNRSTGEYHCHRGGGAPPSQGIPQSVPLKQQSVPSSPSPNYLQAAPVDTTCYTGPRGGRYRIINGKKRYGC
jgi:hypothetical protein